MTALLVGLGLALRAHTGAVRTRVENDNPNRFYRYATGKEFSIRYTYDPHAADLWMFRTAEGHLTGNNYE
jgi:hypothetical protein